VQFDCYNFVIGQNNVGQNLRSHQKLKPEIFG